jgi:hypothetical protein
MKTMLCLQICALHLKKRLFYYIGALIHAVSEPLFRNLFNRYNVFMTLYFIKCYNKCSDCVTNQVQVLTEID